MELPLKAALRGHAGGKKCAAYRGMSPAGPLVNALWTNHGLEQVRPAMLDPWASYRCHLGASYRPELAPFLSLTTISLTVVLLMLRPGA